jgi:hypothetical protein
VSDTILVDAYIIDHLLADLVGQERHPSSFLVYLYLWRRAAGRRKRRIEASYQTIADGVGISKSAAQAAIRTLTRRRLVSVEHHATTAVPVYWIAAPWR